MNFKYKQIINLFTNPKNTLYFDGLWFSGVEYEGEFKDWFDNGQIWEHSHYKDGEKDGEYKKWYYNGQLRIQGFYKNGDKNGEYKTWHENGQLYKHELYKNGKVIKDYMK